MSGGYNPNLPINPNPGPDEAGIIIYNYIPSLALAIVAIISFAVAFGLHLWWAVRTRYHTFHGLFTFGSAMEVVGWGCRAASHYRPFVVNYFIIQYLLIVCAPAFYSGALYLGLSLAARKTKTESLLPLRPKLIVAFYVTADVTTILIQVLGAGLIGASESARARGDEFPISSDAANNILLAGLAVQNACFLTFLIILTIFIMRVRKRGASLASNDNESAGSGTNKEKSSDELSASPLNNGKRSVKPLLTVLYILFGTAMCVWLRTLFRLGETAEGVFGFASSTEALFGCLEYAPVVVAIGAWAIFPLEKLLKT